MCCCIEIETGLSKYIYSEMYKLASKRNFCDGKKVLTFKLLTNHKCSCAF